MNCYTLLYKISLGIKFLSYLKDAGDGRGTAKALLDKIAELESEAQKSLMHR